MLRRFVPRMYSSYWAALAVLSLLIITAPSASAQGPAPSDLGQIFKQYDRNGDRTLDREEYHRLIVEAFFFRDRDKDGYLVMAEFTEVSAERFRAADRDGDGRLSLQEYVNVVFKDFDSADRDGDGVLTYEELEIYIRTTGR